ncbi:hypothetical protein CC1G_07868 [Coprinopsis cinerea okayama7|uniref:Uncharacterized protein n=1 Tax=Coprinopsis cinerea (strain Okayama-7 / 130 / ATCC MYA-4618 / FGSC 9003) TaxID=240176 RepID=A8P445_COPC7|nr:hypothetical protein CC1G_07868 [Coprinopsis cinerea okayama7\|eukprot:XP_001838677.2 hypothetical protein CC1G_07868 [Coprinopsis cinerea okayama7\
MALSTSSLLEAIHATVNEGGCYAAYAAAPLSDSLLVHQKKAVSSGGHVVQRVHTYLSSRAIPLGVWLAPVLSWSCLGKGAEVGLEDDGDDSEPELRALVEGSFFAFLLCKRGKEKGSFEGRPLLAEGLG